MRLRLVADQQALPLPARGGAPLQGPPELADSYAPSRGYQVVDAQRGGISRRLLLGFGVALALAVALVLAGPVLARVPSESGRANLIVSRYSELAAGEMPVVVSAPNIDATAGGRSARQAPAPAPAPSGSYDLVSAPSISVQQIESVLQQYGSPAAGQGQVLYDMGVRYGVDPAFALAFFVHESACGTRGVARSTHSLGNIRWTEGYDNFQGYRSYASWQDGMEDWYKLITDLYINGWGLRTVDQIIPVYAPSADGNSPQNYVASVKWLVDSWRGK
jgi:hypothetical protein